MTRAAGCCSLGLLLVIALLSACAADTPTTVLLRIEPGDVDAPPASLALTVLAEEGVLLERRVPAQGMPELPGEAVLYPDRNGGELRLWVRALDPHGAQLGSGAGRVMLIAHQQTSVTIVLTAAALPDRDGDGVPDAVDNCPDWPNPRQEPCPAEGGPGDASDGGPPDLRHDLAPDRGRSDTTNCDEDDDGHRALSCGGPDCDDHDPNVHPGAAEGPPGGALCKDGKDNNCNGLMDLTDPGCRACNDNADCEDKNACTADSCVAGLCVNTPQLGQTCTGSDVCTSNTTCDANGVCGGGSPTTCPPASNPCKRAICVSPLGCTTQDAPNGQVCDDGVPCTEAACQAGVCTPASTDLCYVASQCYKPGESVDGCFCDPARSTTVLLPPIGGCQVGPQCVPAGTFDADGCQCSGGLFGPPSGGCRIGGVCYAQGHVDGLTQCLCQGSVDPNTWTPAASDCQIDGQCYAGGATNGPCLSCIPNTSKTTWSGPCAGAIIMAGVNTAQSGDLGGASGADTLCTNAASAAGVRTPSAVKAFLATSGRSLGSLVAGTEQGRRVVAITGQQLFTSWTAMLGGAKAPNMTVRTWNGTLVDEPMSSWHDADAWVGATSNGQPSGLDCGGWTSASSLDDGTVYEIDLPGLLTNSKVESCDLPHAVLCVWAL